MIKHLIIIYLTLLFSVNLAIAGENREIDFLLSFVATSDCIFIRNGEEHPNLKASKHLAKKYNYAKSRIKTAEDFIAKIASKSSISKKPYHVRCEGKTLLAKQWFTAALASHRDATGIR
jgi:hypothetical protein